MPTVIIRLVANASALEGEGLGCDGNNSPNVPSIFSTNFLQLMKTSRMAMFDSIIFNMLIILYAFTVSINLIAQL